MAFNSKTIATRIRDNLIGGGHDDFEPSSLLLLLKTSSSQQTDDPIAANSKWTKPVDDNRISEPLNDNNCSDISSEVDGGREEDFCDFVPGAISSELLWPASSFKVEVIDQYVGPIIKTEEEERELKSEEETYFLLQKEQEEDDDEKSPPKSIVSKKKPPITAKPPKVWDCTECGRQFQHHYTYLRHLPTHTDIRDFVCKICGKAFRQLSTLSQHQVIHSKNRPFNCDVCHKDFNRISTLISHRKTHSTVKNFQCHICLKGFHQKGNLRNHVYIHSNERPYRCTLCPKGFNQMSNLVCHTQKTHSADVAAAAAAAWQCSSCAESFSKRSQLRAHELAKHQIMENNDKNIVKNELDIGQTVDAPNPSESNEILQTIQAEPVISPIAPILTTTTTTKMPNNHNPTIHHHQQRSLHSPIAAAAAASSSAVVNKGVIIPAIQTDAMHTVRSNNEIPFAVLHFLQCVPLLVRVIEFRDHQSLLRPANKYDFEELRLRSLARNNASTKFSVSVVAAVYQTVAANGSTSFVVMPPRNIDKFSSNLQNLSMQDAVFSMAMAPTTAAPPPSSSSSSVNNSVKAAPKKCRQVASQVVATAPQTEGSKRKVRPMQTMPAPRNRSNNAPLRKSTSLLATTVAQPKPSEIVTRDEGGQCAPSVVVQQPLSYQVVEQEHLLDNGDITKAIQGFATGSFLSPKKPRSQIASPPSECDFASPQSTTSSSIAESTASSSSSGFSSASDADASRAFLALVSALESDGHTPDLDSINEFIYSSAMFGTGEWRHANEFV